jgi:hypothetical protein
MRTRLPALLLMGAALAGCNSAVTTSPGGKGPDSDKPGPTADKTDPDLSYYTIKVNGMH